jgi:5-methylcytosine-specific restriction endonuclease McrA
MTRPFSFTDKIKTNSRIRQYGLCAICGDLLDDEYEHAHHVIPNQSGNPANPLHSWLKESDNCVVLCVPCHDRVHENGNYKVGAVAPPSYFKFSHGKDNLKHKLWLDEMNIKAREFWQP